MAQKRFFDRGAPATSATLKTVQSSLFAPGLLFGAEPVIAASDEFTVSEHGVIFESGIILTEDEVKSFVVTTAAGAQNLTLVYNHTDTTSLGGAAASLTLESGLLTSGGSQVALLWIVYPGGGAALSVDMFFSPPRMQVTLPTQNVGVGMVKSTNFTRVLPSAITPASIAPWADITVPAVAPFEVTLDPADVLVADGPPNITTANGNLVMYEKSTAIFFGEIATAPPPGRFNLNYATRTLTFNGADAGKVLTCTDLTYGTEGLYFDNTGGSVRDDFAVTFTVGDLPPKQIIIKVATVRGTAPSIGVARVIDTAGETLLSFQLPNLGNEIDDRIVITRRRIIEGTFEPGKEFTVIFGLFGEPTSEYFLISAAVSAYDEPFTVL